MSEPADSRRNRRFPAWLVAIAALIGFLLGGGSVILVQSLRGGAGAEGQPSPLLSGFSFRDTAKRHSQVEWQVLIYETSRVEGASIREFVAMSRMNPEEQVRFRNRLTEEAEKAIRDSGWEVTERGATLAPAADERLGSDRHHSNYHLSYKAKTATGIVRFWLIYEGKDWVTLIVLVIERP